MHNVTIDPAGGGEVYLQGLDYQSLPSGSTGETREAAIQILTERAKQLGHTLDVHVTDTGHYFTLQVQGDGHVNVTATNERVADTPATSVPVSAQPYPAWEPDDTDEQITAAPICKPVAVITDDQDYETEFSTRRKPQIEVTLEFEDGNIVKVESAAVLGRRPIPPADFLDATVVPLGLQHGSTSKTHCLITVEDGTVALTDLGSTNGTDVEHNGDTAIAPPGTRIELHDGDSVHLGDSAALVRIVHG